MGRVTLGEGVRYHRPSRPCLYHRQEQDEAEDLMACEHAGLLHSKTVQQELRHTQKSKGALRAHKVFVPALSRKKAVVIDQRTDAAR